MGSIEVDPQSLTLFPWSPLRSKSVWTLKLTMKAFVYSFKQQHAGEQSGQPSLRAPIPVRASGPPVYPQGMFLCSCSVLVSTESPERCCDICHPSLFDQARPRQTTSQRKTKLRVKGKPDLDAQARLDEWRQEVFLRDHATSYLDPGAILDESAMTALTVVGPLTSEQVESLLSTSWVWWTRYGAEITSVLTSQKIKYCPFPKKTKPPVAALGPTPPLLCPPTPPFLLCP